MIEENSKLRIRKLTPRECARLMAFTDKDFEAMASVNSDSQIYKQCGNSIVVNVLMAIFEEMLPHEQKDESITDSEDIVEKPVLWGGIGDMKSNNGKQYYQQNRIYDADAIALCQSAHEGFNPYYKVEENEID